MAVALMFIGKIGHSTAARVMVIMSASLAGWGAFALRSRLVNRNE
jgi:hypothetical protein